MYIIAFDIFPALTPPSKIKKILQYTRIIYVFVGS